MFNFHKPRTYRSAEGCCICKAKSSSSRFADSRKFERDIMQCFDLKYARQGEICNACVLLVKRYKRLPVGSKRNWSHIVDAKAGIGPGYNKIQTKHKSERINSKVAAQQQQQGTVSSISANANNNNTAINVGASALNGFCFIPEKFSKIFKKTKKIKESSSQSSKRKTTNNGWSQNNNNSLPTALDSLDSDYEDSRLHASLSSNAASTTVVQFQTQTRASAHKAQAAAEARKKIMKLGTKRRKCLPPRRYCRSMTYEQSLQFFDEEEWRESKSCCGILYECTNLVGALLIDSANYKPCEQHGQRMVNCQEKLGKCTIGASNPNYNDNKKTTALPKSIIHSVPAVVQLQPVQAATPLTSVSSSAHSFSITNHNSFKTTAVPTTTATPTPVLKKHHLFYKRQSECFPQGDIVTSTTNTNNNNTNSTPAHVINNIKTESVHHQNQLHHNQQQLEQQQNNITLQRHIENAIHTNSLNNSPATILTDSLTSLALSISVTSSLPSPSSLYSLTTPSSATITTMPQMPKHSLAKVTTISPPLTTSIQQFYNNNSSLVLPKPNSFPHKVKSDSGKIAKHSLEKFNTAVRLKANDINEMKPIIRTVDKSYMLAKSPTQANIVSLNSTTTAQLAYQSLASYNITGQPSLTTAPLSAPSPTSSTSSTKFSDNSSDSGFDENMLDRKSASPLQEDCDKKMLSRPGVQTMFLTNGVQIQSQPQNLVLHGNEVAAKMLQNRKYSTITASPIGPNARSLTSNHPPTTSAVKITQISTHNQIPSSSSSASNSVGPPISMSSAAQAKMRAIYNNNSTIQHENGITTIVPASSLAASTQTAAMQNIAPSTVTITPAPPVGTQFNPQNVISRKLTTNIINLQSNTSNSCNSHNNTCGNHHHLSSSNNNNHNSTTNQKIILLKTSNSNTTTVTTPTSYNTGTGGGIAVQQMGNSSGR